MDIFQLIVSHNTTLSAIATLFLGLWIYHDRRNDPRNISFGTLLFVVSMWTFSLVLWQSTDEPTYAFLWLRTMFFISSLIPPLFLIFVLAMRGVQKPSLFTRAAIILPNTGLFIDAYFNPSLVKQVQGLEFTLGAGRGLFAIHYVVFLAISLFILYRISRREDSESRTIIYILIGAIIAFNSLSGILFGTSFSRAPNALFIANIGLIVGMAFMASSLISHKFLLHIKLLGPQIFVLLTLFVIIFNIVITEDTIDTVLRVTMLAILIGYAGITTRALIQEVRRMEDVERTGKQAVEMNRSLIEADRMKTRFVSLASHQLRAPVSGVRMYLDMLKKGDFGTITEKQKKVLTTNSNALTRLGETIETFLDAAKIQLGSLNLYRSEADLTKIINDVIGELYPLAKKKGLALVASVSKDFPMVKCDSGKIYHVILNLVDNSIKYSKQGVITISADVEDDKAVIRITDQGAGIDTDHREHIFDVFKRGMDAVKLDTGGSGLGLYIVKSIIDAHEGTLIVESEGRGKGSVFGFSLPM
ncbi:ATP-binding protein [Patescibacteria group bacterium]